MISLMCGNLKQQIWSRNWQPTPGFLPEEFHGQRRLAGYSSWGHKESDMTEQLTYTHTQNNENSNNKSKLMDTKKTGGCQRQRGLWGNHYVGDRGQKL